MVEHGVLRSWGSKSGKVQGCTTQERAQQVRVKAKAGKLAVLLPAQNIPEVESF